MIKGLGNDLVEIERIRQSIQKHGSRFLDKVFTPKEQTYCLSYNDNAPRFAGRFSAKEAVVKALGTGFGKEVSFLDVEIINNELGKPVCTLSSSVMLRFEDPEILITITHSKEFAAAVALWQ